MSTPTLYNEGDKESGPEHDSLLATFCCMSSENMQVGMIKCVIVDE